MGSCSWHQCFQPRLSADIAKCPRGKDTSGWERQSSRVSLDNSMCLQENGRTLTTNKKCCWVLCCRKLIFPLTWLIYKAPALRKREWAMMEQIPWFGSDRYFQFSALFVSFSRTLNHYYLQESNCTAFFHPSSSEETPALTCELSIRLWHREKKSPHNSGSKRRDSFFIFCFAGHVCVCCAVK